MSISITVNKGFQPRIIWERSTSSGSFETIPEIELFVLYPGEKLRLTLPDYHDLQITTDIERLCVLCSPGPSSED